MNSRKGYGYGRGMGYKNLVPIDSHIHSLSAKGVKSYPKGVRTNFGLMPTPQKKGLIKEIARKVADGVAWAKEWEKEHLPAQKKWVKKEFEQAKAEAIKLEKLGKQKLKDWKEQMREKKAEGELKKEGFETYDLDLQKTQDLNDVRDELDTNNDGVQDIPISELNKANKKIVSGLDKIDLNNNNIPDHQEEQFTNLSTMEVPQDDFILRNQPEPDEPYQEPPVEPMEVDKTKLGVPFPFMTGKDLEPPKPPQKTFFQKAGEFAQTNIEKGKQYVKKRQAETRELHEIPDAKLKQLAVQEGASAFGGLNKFEKELFRREKEKRFIEKKLKDVREGKTSSSNEGLGGMFGFLNPVSTLSNKSDQKKTSEPIIPDELSFVNPLSTFKPSHKSVQKINRYYDKKLKPKLEKLNNGLDFGFLNPIETLKRK